eukprot:33914-Eustigmatos_ZCMA.PRE.1
MQRVVPLTCLLMLVFFLSCVRSDENISPVDPLIGRPPATGSAGVIYSLPGAEVGHLGIATVVTVARSA